MRQLRTPSDFEAQAAATQQRRQATLMKQAQLRELSAMQAGKTAASGSLPEFYRAQAQEAGDVKEFEEKKRMRQEEGWKKEDKQGQIEEAQRKNRVMGQAASALKASVSGLTGLELQTTLQANYERLRRQLIASGIPADILPPTVTMGQLDQFIQQGYTNDQQFELDKIRLEAETKATKAPRRRIIKGADGYNYYADTGERVLPGATSLSSVEARLTTARNALKDVEKQLRYRETKPGTEEHDALTAKKAGWMHTINSLSKELSGIPDASGISPPSAPIEAPQAAIDMLKADPALKEAFKAKYGYLPEGI